MKDIEKRIEEQSKAIAKRIAVLDYRDKFSNEADMRVAEYCIYKAVRDEKITSHWRKINEERTAPYWRNVSEELPYTGLKVLISDSFNIIHLGYIDTLGDWRFCLNNELVRDDVIKWKPID